MDDWELLRAYAQDGSESAFQQLVERYVDQVYSVAMRQTADAHQAKDVTQAVFLILLRKAGTLSRSTVLPGWLFKVTRHVAQTALRTERRRKEREMQAMESSLTEPDRSTASQVEGHLDDAIASLGERDRDALLLRYFHQRTVPEVAATLGTSEEAAQKRIERAVDKLRRYFGRRGVAVPALALTAVVSARAVQPAPPLLVEGIASLGVPSTPAVSVAAVGLMEGALRTMLLSKLLVPGLVGVTALLIVLPVTKYLVSSRLEDNRVYDLSRDFSAGSNPNGVWSYGWKTAFGEPYTPLTVRHTSFAEGGEGIPSWQLTSFQTPAVYKNTNDLTVIVEHGVTLVPPGTVWFLPGEDGRPESLGVIRFTVPTNGAGMYRLETAVRPGHSGPPQGDSDFHVLLNGTELFGRFLSPVEGVGYTNTLRLAAGDTIDFAIGRGKDGRQFGSVLNIDARLQGTKEPALTASR